MINTFSAFVYGHTVDQFNSNLNFNEGGPELTATLNIGEYSLTDFCTEIARAMNDVGALTYSCSVDRSTRIITISATGSFEILGATGTNVYDSGPLGVSATNQGVIEVRDFQLSAAVPLVGPLPGTFIWTVQFSGLIAEEGAGLSWYGPVVVGQAGAGIGCGGHVGFHVCGRCAVSTAPLGRSEGRDA